MLDFLTSLFTDFTTADSFIILAFLLGAFLIGLLFGRRSVTQKYKDLQKTLGQKESELISTQAEKEALIRKADAQEVELQKTNGFLKRTKAQLTQAEKDKDQYYSALQTSQEKLTTLEQNNSALSSRIEVLEKESGNSYDLKEELQQKINILEKEALAQKAQITQLQEEKDQIRTEEESYRANLIEENKAAIEKSNITTNRMNMIEAKLERMDQENEHLKEALSAYQKANTSNPSASLDINAVHTRLAQLEKENQQLQLAIENLQGEEDITVELEEEDIIFAEEAPAEDEVIEEIEVNLEEVFEEDEEEEDDEDDLNDPIEAYDFISTREKAEKARAQLNTVFGKKIPTATRDNKDNLQLIDGIGPFIEEQLNTIGIYNFLQISKFDDQTIQLVTDAIQFFPGRIKRDDWKGQAIKAISKRK